MTTHRIRTALEAAVRELQPAPRVPAADAKAHILHLSALGMLLPSIARAAGVPEWLPRRILEDRVVNIHDWQDQALCEVEFIPTRIDATPLVEYVEANIHHIYTDDTRCGAQAGVSGVMPDSDARLYYRARQRGHISPWMADRLLHDHFGVTLNRVYGPSWEDYAA